MTKAEILALMKEKGKADALDLRSRAKDLDGTAIIAEESKIPLFDPEKDYSSSSYRQPLMASRKRAVSRSSMGWISFLMIFGRMQALVGLVRR